MADQLPLDFTAPPVARRMDPPTSHEAAQAIDETGSRRRAAMQVLDAVRRFPGRTGRELAQEAGLDPWGVSRRLSDLKHWGLIRFAGEKACTVTNRKAGTWVAEE